MSGKIISKGLYSEILFCLLFLLFPRQIMAETFSFTANSMESVMAEGRERIILNGSAELLSEDNRIFADVIELYGENFIFAHCHGRVKVLNNKQGIELFADELFYNRRKKVVRIKGNAVMADKKNEIVVKGGFIEHWEERDESIIQLGVRILKKIWSAEESMRAICGKRSNWSWQVCPLSIGREMNTRHRRSI